MHHAPAMAATWLLCVLTACTSTAPKTRAASHGSGQHGDLGPEAPKQLTLAPTPRAAAGQRAPLLGMLEEELRRSMREFGARTKPAPYYLALEVASQDRFVAQASLGALVEAADTRSRILDVDVRVGSPELDNTHPIRGHWDASRNFTRAAWLPIDDDPSAITREIWLTTNAEYERAIEELVFVRANRDVKVAEEDASADFSQEPSIRHVEPTAELVVDRAGWNRRLTEHARRLALHPHLYGSSVDLDAVAENRYLVNSDGSVVQTSRTWARVLVSASTIAPDGMELSRTEIVDARAADALPDDANLAKVVDRVAAEILALREAPVVQPYTGPAILDGKAAGVFFHEIFGHRVEGHRQKNAEEGQTFANKIGEQIMPAFLDVYDDPNVWALNGEPLHGHYAVDDEGVAASRAVLVDDGVLRGFLMSRSPTRGFLHSNGHGRRQSGHRIVARQGNLVVDPARVTTLDALKRLLIEEVKRQKKPFGLRFSEITGGYTTTTTDSAQAFKVLPVMVYRVFPDGREELVRGVDLEGTPLTVLSRIVAAADDFQVFNGMCGAESGWVPVSASSPSLLVSQMEIARRERSQERPPILPAPGAPKGSSTTELGAAPRPARLRASTTGSRGLGAKPPLGGAKP
jgi:TldD protein